MNIHYKTNMNTQHNEYQHVITKNVFKHNFLVTLNILISHHIKVPSFVVSTLPSHLCNFASVMSNPNFVLSRRQLLCQFGISFQYQWHDLERPLDFPWFLVQSAKSGVKDQGTFPFLTASDSSGSTKSQPYLTSWINWWVSYKQPQHSQGMDTLHRTTHVLGRHIWCFIVAYKTGKWIEMAHNS